MRIVLLIVLCLSIGSANAQVTFQKVLRAGGSHIISRSVVRPASDGGYIVLGAAGDHFYLVKTDSLGVPVWKRLVELCSISCYSSNAFDVVETADSGFVVVGTRDNVSGGACMVFYNVIFIHRFSAAGATVWRNEFIHFPNPLTNFAYTVSLAPDGTVLIGGANFDGLLIKTDSLGNLLWQKRYPGLGEVVSNRVLEDQSLVAVGNRSISAGNMDVYLMKADGVGVPAWCRTYGTAGDETASAVRQLADGGYIISGSAMSGGPDYDVFLIRTDSLGNTLWSKKYGDTGTEAGTVMPTTDGGFIVGGSSNSFAGGVTRAFLMKVDSIGIMEWVRAYGDSSSEGFTSVSLTPDGGYVVGGYSNSFGNGSYLVKTDSLGQSGCFQSTPSFAASPVSLTGVPFSATGQSVFISTHSPFYQTITSSGTIAALCPGCTSSQVPSITGNSAPFCPGDSITLSSSPASAYFWSDGRKTQHIRVGTSGGYTVTAADTMGCTATSAPFIVTTFPSNVPVISVSGNILTSTPAVSYQWYYNGIALNNGKSQSFTAVQDGVYRVATTDTNGCTFFSVPYSFLLSLTSVDADASVLIYPNPTPGSFTLDAPTDGAMILTDVTGRQISNATLKRGPNVLTMPADQSTGIYIVNFTTTDDQKSVVRLLYQK